MQRSVIGIMLIIVVLLAILIKLTWNSDATVPKDKTDALPVRLGVVMLGSVVLLALAGLIYVGSSPPQVAKDEITSTNTQSESSEAAGGEEGSEAAGGEEGSEAANGETTTTSAAANAANLGLSGQIVGVFGTIAAAAVGGIAGVLSQARS